MKNVISLLKHGLALVALLGMTIGLDMLLGTDGGVSFAALLGYTKVCTDASSGVYKIYFAEATTGVASMTATARVYTTITMVSLQLFKVYEFREDECELTFKTIIENGARKTVSELSFALDKLSPESSACVDEIAAKSNCGLVGVVHDNKGNKWVLGYSEDHALTRPLRLKSADATTGKGMTDPNNDVLTLSCESKGRPYTTSVTPVTA